MKPLEQVTARELMQEDLVLLHELAPIKEAVETFEDYQISGAPVVNEAGELVGVLSASDIVKREHVSEDHIEAGPGAYHFADPLDEALEGAPWGDEPPFEFGTEEYPPELLGRVTVGDWMTPEVISVTPETGIFDVCRTMAKHRIHRVIVVEGKRPVGVISTFDIVNYLAGSP